ncbi:hypothetical protein IGI04_019387 [Brassica rapa subsp. trilocularis]|uniref:CCHC-type domain-containing protein n=1 Tax=Brassica rapa subsp. trilocularis TaxID=1813537 RepID=A0ABQ7MH95_BRACM|nr:hypothetical protein IGI04_019387 [Brassica rapa subsp. trilocularis]
MTSPRYGQRNSENHRVYSNLEVTDDSAIAQGNNHCYEHKSTGRNPTDSHMGYEQEERYEDLRERNQAPDMYGSRRNFATTHNPRQNESEFMHRERTPEPRCRQEQRTAGSSDPLIVLVQGLLDRLDHRTGELSERRPSSPPDYLKMGRKAPDYITCFSCGEKGHYANSCPHKRQVTLPAPPTRLAIEPAPKRQAVGKQVNALELGKPEPQQPHQGPITAARHVLLLYWRILQAALAYVLLVEMVAGHKTCFNWTDLWLHTNFSPIGCMGHPGHLLLAMHDQNPSMSSFSSL